MSNQIAASEFIRVYLDVASDDGTVRDVAEKLGRSTSAVRSRARRCRARGFELPMLRNPMEIDVEGWNEVIRSRFPEI